jgi:DNA-binding MarR family transcriptional regulator
MRLFMKKTSIGKEISEISRTMNRFVDKEVAHLKLSNATVPFIAQLFSQDGVHQEELAEKLHFDKSSAARALTALEKAGYVVRVQDSKNKRRNIIYVTENGRAVRDELMQILASLTKRLFEGFSDEEMDEYYTMTERLRTNLMRMAGKNDD